MSKLDDLIQSLCPDGVDKASLKSVAVIGTGNSNRVDNSENGQYPFFVRSKTVMKSSSFSFDEEAIIIPGEGGVGDIFHYINGKYDLHQRAYRIYFSNSRVNTKYAYYYLSTNFKKYIMSKAVSGTVISIRKPMIEDFQISIPPLEVQKEIVRILDKFTILEAELEARLLQYNHYRKILLDQDNNYPRLTLGEIGKVAMCRRILKNQTLPKGEVPFYKIGTFGKAADAFISQNLYEVFKKQYPFPKKGDILISAAGTIGRTVIYDGLPAYFQDSNIVWINHNEEKVLNKYLYYFYSLGNWAVLEGGTISRLYNYNLEKTLVPVPNLSEQHRIVGILDRFENMVHDLKNGLPAEIAARHQQYAYYRNQLLSFKQKSTESVAGR